MMEKYIPELVDDITIKHNKVVENAINCGWCL